MKAQLATGFIPYEIGDTVQLKNSVFQLVVEDMRMIQTIKDKTVEFEVLLDGVWYDWKLIEKRIIP